MVREVTIALTNKVKNVGNDVAVNSVKGWTKDNADGQVAGASTQNNEPKDEE